VCAVGCKKAEAHKHTWATEWSVGGETHWHACTGEGCTAKKDEGNHEGGTANCTDKKVCTVCDNAYGEVDSSVHKSDEFVYVSNGDGTHTKKYKCCNAVAAEPENCSGEAATVCGEKSVCEVCHAEYGEPLAHDWDTEWTTTETQHWHKCKRTGCEAKKDEADHTVGTAATCTAKAVCATCNAEYGEKDANNHDLENHAAQAPTCTEAGWDEYVTCKRTGCTYTTYQAKPALGHDYTVQDKDENQHWNKCSRCNVVDETSKTNHSVTTWETTDTGRVGKCSCGAIVITAVENVPVEDITLYTVESLNGKDYAHTATYEYIVTVNGTAKEVAFTLNGDAATFDKATNTFTGVKAGEITVTASYTIADGVSESKTFKVIVERPEITVETPVKYFSAIDGKDSSADMFVLFGDAEFTATQVYNGQSYTLTVDKENKTLKGAHAESKTPTVSTITLENDMFAVTYNVTVYTKVINDYTDFEDMRLTADRKTVEGYFIMNADIDFKGVEINGAKDNYNATFYPRFDVNSKPDAQDYITGAGFNGVFDGNGHDIKGYQAGNSFGFFGSIKGTSLKDMAVIKNVSFTNVYSGANWTLSRLFAQNAAFVSVENVYISFNLQSEWTARFALFGCGEANTFRFNNIVMEMTKAFAGQGTTDAGNNGGVGIFKDAGTTLWFATDTANNSGHHKGFTIYKNFYFVVPNAGNGRVMPMFQNSSASVYASNDFVEFTTEGATATLNSSLNPEASESGTMKVYHLTNAYRYDNYEQMKEKTTKVGNWDITSGSPVWDA
ncbi:MAG: hypothetical protein PUI94_01110, partial [Eubacteriales bacterium]|nr:hypothetical protein [Eubacteriales bacterium]